MRPKPCSPQEPKPCHRVDVHVMQAITGVILSLLTSAMTDTRMLIAPLFHTAVEVLRSRVHPPPRCTRRVNQRRDRGWWHVFQPPDDHVTTTLAHAEDRRLLRCEPTPSACALEPPAPAAPPCFPTASGWPCCPATRETSSQATASLPGGVGFFETIPGRHCQVSCCTADG
jgi:hypothetical protein